MPPLSSLHRPTKEQVSPLYGLSGGVGHNVDLSWGGKQPDPIMRNLFPHSLDLCYSAFTNYTGFKVNSGEYKGDGAGPLWGAQICEGDL